MKLGLLGFYGRTALSRTRNLGIYRPESNTNIQAIRRSVRSYIPSKQFPLSFSGLAETSITGLTFSQDGTKVYVCGNAFNIIFQYALNIPWDISSYTSVDPIRATTDLDVYIKQQTGNLASLSNPQGITFNSSGTKMQVVDNFNNKVVEFTLSTPWDVSTATFPTSGPWPIFWTFTGVGTAANRDDYDICFSTDQKNLFLLGRDSTNGSYIYQYSLKSGRTGGSIGTEDSLTAPSSLSTNRGSNYAYFRFLNVNAVDSAMRGMSFDKNGRLIFLSGTTNRRIYNLRLPRGNYDISSYTFDGVDLTFDGLERASQAVFVNVNRDNVNYYYVGENETIYQHDLVLR